MDIRILACSTPRQQRRRIETRQERELEIKRQKREGEAEVRGRGCRKPIQAKREKADAASRRALAEEAARKDREEYDRAVQRAEATREYELSQRRRFSDTTVGQLYDAAGGAAPFVPGSGEFAQRGILGPGAFRPRLWGWGSWRGCRIQPSVVR